MQNNPSDFFPESDNQTNQFSQNNTAPQPSTPEPPMKWHKFLIYFSLWAGALVNVSNAAMMMTGGHYGVSSDELNLIYNYFSGLKSVDMLMGLVSLGLAALLIVTRFSLARFKANGPKLLMLAYAMNAAVSVLYVLIVSAVTKLSIGELMDASSVTQIITSVAMIFINKTYYDKRASLFVN